MHVYAFEHIGGPHAGITVMMPRMYLWYTSSSDESGYYKWDQPSEAYVWTAGKPPDASDTASGADDNCAQCGKMFKRRGRWRWCDDCTIENHERDHGPA